MRRYDSFAISRTLPLSVPDESQRSNTPHCPLSPVIQVIHLLAHVASSACCRERWTPLISEAPSNPPSAECRQPDLSERAVDLVRCPRWGRGGVLLQDPAGRRPD